LRFPGVIVASTLLTLFVPGVVGAFDSDDANLPIVDKYLGATKVQQEKMRGLQMDVNIDAKIPSLKEHGTMQALRVVSHLGQILYQHMDFVGDQRIKKDVIARYLEAETEARDSGAIAINPTNYKFQLKGRLTQSEQLIYIFKLTPKKKKQGLFKGELWLDSATGMPVREAGELVKTPSIFLKKVVFVRDYLIKDGVALPSHIQSTVDTRVVGRAELSIDFTNYAPEIDEPGEAALR
jgi:hypothetical protein